MLLLTALGLNGCKNPAEDLVLSQNAELASLTVSAGTLDPAFSPSVTSYSVSVGNVVESIAVTGTVADPGAKVSDNNGSVQRLSVGSNTIPIVVTAADGRTAKSYVVTVVRAKADESSSVTNVTLLSLTVSAGTLTPAFSPDVTDYSVDVPADAASITVTGVAAGTDASVGGASGVATELKGGANAISIVVTAADKTTTKTYTVSVYRAKAPDDSSNADLSGLRVQYADLVPAFSSSVTEYTAIVGRNTANVTLVGICANSMATLGGDNNSVKTLSFGENAIKVTVTAPDKTTVKTYAVTVTRVNDTTPPTLKDLTFSPTEIDSSKGDAVVGGTVVAEDPSGVRYVELYFSGPEGSRHADVVKDESKSTKTLGVYAWSITVKKGARGGTWSLNDLEMGDQLINRGHASLSDYNTKFIDKAPKGDQTPPKLISFTLSPTEVNSTDADAVVGGRAVAEDESGVRTISIVFWNRDGSHYASLVKDMAKSTATHSEYEWSVTVKKGSRGDEWKLDRIETLDELMNRGNADISGYPKGFVDKASPGDITPPKLKSFTVSTDMIDSKDGDVTVKGKIIAEDDMSGVRFATLKLEGPGGRREATLTRVDPVTTPRLYAEYDWSFTVAKGTLGGVWSVYTFEIVDEKFNRAYPVVPNAKALFTDNAPAK